MEEVSSPFLDAGERDKEGSLATAHSWRKWILWPRLPTVAPRSADQVMNEISVARPSSAESMNVISEMSAMQEMILINAVLVLL